ncbi:AI-2E family transporter [Candidatus Saccharibacteria bacterium]|nr:AI-2E family transporter [Candidatus Saccharibacteria bacterium]
MSRQIVEIETKTFVRFWLVILGFAILIAFVVTAREALTIIGISILLAIAIRPLALKVNSLIGRKTKRSDLASVLAYLLVLLVIAAIVAVIGPVIVSEFSKFLTTLPETVRHTDLSGLNELGKTFGIENLSTEIIASIEDFSKNLLGSLGSGVMSGISTIGGFIGKAAITLVLTLFMLLEGPDILENLWGKLGAKHTIKEVKDEKDRDVRLVTEARLIATKMARVISTFVSKQVTIAIIDGCVTAISVLVLSLIFGLDTRLAIPAGLITMVFYLIPMFGQVIGAALVALILFITSPIMAVIWLAFYIVYGFIEANILAPKVQGSALKLSPVIILVAITIGTYMMGLIGAIVAIPIAGCVKVLIDEYPRMRELSKN